MTEAEWLACDGPAPMLKFLGPEASGRKLRLFACACCRRTLRLMPARHTPARLKTAERVADGEATESEWKAASGDRFDATHDLTGWALLPNPFNAATHASEYTVRAAYMHKPAARRHHFWLEERAVQAGLLHDIFGDPFRPVAVESAWLTSTAVQLARGVYAERAFDRLPILADALQDAGCDNADILAHCRDPHQVHVRGCWVVDLVLGKE